MAMIRHVVAWDFKEGFTDAENKNHADLAKERFDELSQIGITGVEVMDFRAELLPASTRKVVLNSLFTNTEALLAYKRHPIHMELVDIMAKYFDDRVCVDFIE